jgi:hypothetical protein
MRNVFRERSKDKLRVLLYNNGQEAVYLLLINFAI